MATYSYSAIDSQGKSVNGSLQGDTARQVRNQLRKQGLTPITVDTVSERKSRQAKAQSRFFSKRLALSDLALFTRQFATLIAAGLPIDEALQTVAEQETKPNIKTLIQSVRDKVLEGYPLADALRQFPAAFSELYCATVAAGEQTGRLDVILVRLAEYVEQQHAMRRKIQLALVYPGIMTFISAAIVSFLLVFVVPRIINVFANSGEALPHITQVLIRISELLRDYGLGLCLVALLCLVGIQRLLKNPNYRKPWQRFLSRIPVFGHAMKSVDSARFSRTLGILVAAGVDLIQALKVATSLVNLLPMREAISEASERVREGTALHLALRQTKAFSPMVIHLIANGESSGRLPEMLEYVAEHQENEVKRLIDTVLALFEPILILLMGLVVLFIVLAILLPIFELGQIIS